MKFLTNKKWLCLWVVLILLVGVLLAAGTASSEPPTEVTDELLDRIENDFAKYRYANGANPEIDGPWPVEYCYGIYNGCVAVMFSEPAFDAGWDEVIGSTTIHYRDGSFIRVWCNGNFIRLEVALEQGLLSQKDISEIADIHRNVRYNASNND